MPENTNEQKTEDTLAHIAPKIIDVNGVDLRLTPVRMGKKSDTPGLVYFAPDKVSPEALEEAYGKDKIWENFVYPKLRQYFGNIWRICTNKGADELNEVQYQQMVTSLSLRGETIAVLTDRLLDASEELTSLDETQLAQPAVMAEFQRLLKLIKSLQTTISEKKKNNDEGTAVEAEPVTS